MHKETLSIYLVVRILQFGWSGMEGRMDTLWHRYTHHSNLFSSLCIYFILNMFLIQKIYIESKELFEYFKHSVKVRINFPIILSILLFNILLNLVSTLNSNQTKQTSSKGYGYFVVKTAIPLPFSA